MDEVTTARGSRGSAAIAARAAGVSQILLALGFGGGAIWTLLHLQANGELPMTPWGFRAMSGPAENLGQAGFTALGVMLVAISAVDLVAGVRLWQLRRDGLRLGLLTALPGFPLALAFALPFLLVGIPVRVLLALAGRGALR
jgi:hypothetical protein